MHILVVGKGGREHALARALKDSPSQPTVVAWPGSDGMADIAPQADVADAADLVPFMQRAGIDLCVVGEESYLAAGLADEARAAGIPVWGPDQAAAQMEASKEFAKQFMFRHDIPTGASVTVFG